MSLYTPKHELPWATLFCLDGDSSSDDIWEDLGTIETRNLTTTSKQVQNLTLLGAKVLRQAKDWWSFAANQSC